MLGMSRHRDREPPGRSLTVRPDGVADFSSEAGAGRVLGAAIDHDLRARVELFARVCRGVAFAHQHGFAHGRLAGQPILVADDGGIAIEGWMDPADSPAAPDGLSPEQVRGEAGAFAPASDLFALGVILYQLITARRPFTGDTPLALTLSILEGEPPPPSSLTPSVPRALDELCGRLLAKDPHDRPGSAQTVAETAVRALTVADAVAEPAARTPALPTVAPDRYRLGAEIARGGLGKILEARDLRLDRPVAVKQLIAPEPGAAGRFLREALITARLQHPAIVPVHEAGRWPSGEPFYAMKRIAGRSLDRVIAEAGSFKQRLALLPHLIAVADAVAYAHSQRVIHRDLKPANILVGEFGETVVIDWGLAKDLAQPEEGAAGAAAGNLQDGLTVAGAVLGTPAYMPPEQAHGEPVDERADVYALGAILYHMLAGEPPYRSSMRVLVEVMSDPPPSLASRQKGVPRDLVAIVDKAMARAPAARYPSARELAEDVKKFQTGSWSGRTFYSPLERLRRFGRRYRALLALGGAALVALVVLGLVDRRRILAREREASRAPTRSPSPRRASSSPATPRARWPC
jgi:serine/threonine protein kinase